MLKQKNHRGNRRGELFFSGWPPPAACKRLPFDSQEAALWSGVQQAKHDAPAQLWSIVALTDAGRARHDTAAVEQSTA